MNKSHPTEPSGDSAQDDALILVEQQLTELEQLDPADAAGPANEIADQLATALDEVDEI